MQLGFWETITLLIFKEIPVDRYTVDRIEPVAPVAPVGPAGLSHLAPGDISFQSLLLRAIKGAGERDRSTLPPFSARSLGIASELVERWALPSSSVTAGMAQVVAAAEYARLRVVRQDEGYPTSRDEQIPRRPALRLVPRFESTVDPAADDDEFDAADEDTRAYTRDREPFFIGEPAGYGSSEGFAGQVMRWALECAEEMAELVENALARRLLTLEQLMEWHYREIRGQRRKRIRLFDAGTSAASGFERPKYTTSWDHLLDVEARAILDSYMRRDGRLREVCVPDVNGYHFTQSIRYSRDYTGSPRIDRANMAKEILDDPAALMEARVGLLGWNRVPRRATRMQFLAAGVDIDRKATPGTLILQCCPENDVRRLAIPFFVKEHRYGAVVMKFLGG